MKPISRFAFLGTFLATITAWAQTIITPCRPKLQWSGQIPLCNGQCPNPECAYRAPEWRPGSDNTNQPIAFYTTRADDFNSQMRIVRCPNCNTAFFQDPEPTKTK